jgi:integrase
VLKKASLKTVTLHSLRHSFGTIYLGSGATIKDVQEVLGHSDPAFTMRVYAKLLQSNRSESMARMNAMFVAKKEGKVKGIRREAA